LDVDADEPQAPDEQVFSFDMKRYLDALRKYVWALAAFTALAVTLAVIYTSRLPNVYEAKASIQIEPRLPDLLGQGADLFAATGAGGGAGMDYYNEQKKYLTSYSATHQTVEQFQLHLKLLSEHERANKKLDEQLDIATRRLQAQISVKGPDQDRTMYVTVRSEDAQLAAEIANDHVTTYIDYTKNLLSTSARVASTALSQQFEAEEQNLRKAEAKLFQFQKDHDLLAVSLEDRQNLVSANIMTFTQKMNEARAHRIEIGSKLDRMKAAAASSKDLLDSPILLMGNDNTSFDSLRAQYYTERNAFVQIDKELGPKHADYQKQKAKVDDLLDALHSEAKRIIGGVEETYLAALATEKALGVEAEKYKKEALDFGPNIVAYNELLRDKKSIEDRYTILRNRLSASEMTGRMNSSLDSTYVKRLDNALVPTSPVSPDVRVNASIAGGLAFFIGLGLLMLAVFLDRSIKTTSDAQQAAAVPVVGVIPMVPEADLGTDNDKSRDLYVHEHPTSAVAECCRSLRTNVLFSGAERRLKTIAVSSANPREGKTTSVIYLGITMAQSNQRVLLIDTDMRRPRLHESMGIPRKEGVTNLILGDNRYEEMIKPTEIPNLFVLPCGPTPPNPAELLMTNRFETVLKELESRFDLIILDSPPLQPVTDAVVLSKLVDGVIMVVRAGKTRREEIKRATRQLRTVGGTIIGVIVNEFDARSRDAYYYNYYGYHGSPEDQKKAG
jgi:capsular exopolysaccharide synthesis family protein